MTNRVLCLHCLLVALVCVTGQGHQLHYVVVENEPPPVVIANLTADVLRHGIFQSLINDSADNYLFSFTCEQLPSALHGVTVDNGRLLSRSALDREALGTSGGINVLLAVRRRNASASERPFRLATLRVLINVSDVNDNAPVWTDYMHDENVVTIEFSENAQLGARQIISAATDADTGANSLISYAKSCSVVASNGARLCGSADPFYIKAMPPGAGEIVLVLNNTLDRETVGEYGFTITARDDGSPPLSSTLSLRVLVTDVNDNSPRFTETNYTVSLAENYPVNQAFQRVSAVDPDEGANGQVTYSIRWASLPDYVTIDQFTGELTLVKQLDYEAAPTIDIRVQARDDDRPPKSSTSVVWINVLDINDATPYISVHECGDVSAPSIDIEEHRKPFSTSCRVAAYDDDAGPAGDVQCEVMGSEAAFFDLELASTFASRNPSYFLRLKRELDRERAAQHEVRVQCTDHGTPPQSSSSQLLVHVVDINDCTPKFSGPRLNESPNGTVRLSADARENSEPGTLITRLTANDCDDGMNARLEFQIVNQTFDALPNTHLNEPLFAINAKTGEISVTSSRLDRELGHRFLLNVLVKDNGSPALSSNAVLEVNVQDENDNPCVLTQRSYEFVIDENAVGVELGQIRATDLDSGDNAKFHFYLEGTTSDYDRNRFRFNLEEDTGVLTNLVKLDREQEAVYLFTVRVFDRFRKYNDSAPLTVRVADANDNRPEFLFPTPTNYNAHINYPLVKGDNITRVLAVDPDLAENGTMFFSVSEYQQAVPRLFDINVETGQIYLRRDLEPSDLKGHKLVVRVQDGGRTPLTNEGSVYIYLDKGALPSTYVRSEPGTGQLNNQQSSTPRSYFGGVSDALMLTVFLCAVFVCVIVLASVALLILFRRFKQQRRAARNHHEATKRGNEVPKRDSMMIEGTQRIFVAEKMGTLKQCMLSDPSRFLHSAGATCFSTQQSTNQVCCSTTNAGSDSQQSTHSSSSSCAHDDTGCNNFTTDHSENNNGSNNNNSVHKITTRNQKPSVDKSTVAVIEKTYRESCTPVWKPRTLDKACVNPECVLCRSVSKSATMCISPTTKRQSSSQSATIARDYSVGRRLTESQRVPRRKHVEIRSPATSPNSIRTIGDADFEVETQNSCNDQRAEQAEDETEPYSCGQNLLTNIGPSKSIFRAENLQRQKEHNNVRLSPIDYVTAISVHLQSQETQAPAKSRSDTMKSFNKCPIDSASYV